MIKLVEIYNKDYVKNFTFYVDEKGNIYEENTVTGEIYPFPDLEVSLVDIIPYFSWYTCLFDDFNIKHSCRGSYAN